VTPTATVPRRCPSLPIWLLLLASQLILVGSVWDVAWHLSLGREAFWIPPHLVLYSGVGLTGLVCAVVVVGATWGWMVPSGTDPGLVVRWGRKPPLGFVLAGYGVLGCVLAAPFDERTRTLTPQGNGCGADGDPGHEPRFCSSSTFVATHTSADLLKPIATGHSRCHRFRQRLRGITGS
jgi:hypothetical protein